MQPLPPGSGPHRAPELPVPKTDKTADPLQQSASTSASTVNQASRKPGPVEIIVRREWEIISQKHFKPAEELVSALAAIPDLNVICQSLVKNGWKIDFGPENGGSHARLDKKEIVIDGKHKASRAAIITAVRHETTHANHNWPMVIEKHLQNLLLGEQLSEGLYMSSCADNEGHSMFSEFQLLTMSEHDPALRQEIDDHLQLKYGKADPSGAAYRKGIAFHEQWRSADTDAKEELTHLASSELGRLFADFVGMRSQRAYKESWKADFAKTPFARPLRHVTWALPGGKERQSPYPVKIDVANFERALNEHDDPRKAREIMTHAVNEVIPEVSKETAGDIWNVNYTFSKNGRDYKVHYQYDFWLSGVDSQKIHIEGLGKPAFRAREPKAA